MHCEKCIYHEIPRVADITIGDFWGIAKILPGFSGVNGVSVIICNNEKGKKLVDSIPKTEIGMIKEAKVEWLHGNGYTAKGSHNFISSRRDAFYSAIRTMSFGDAVNFALRPQEQLEASRGSSVFTFSRLTTHFRFDAAFWRETNEEGMPRLESKSKNPPLGKFATLSLVKPLKRDKAYIFKIRFRIKTDSQFINFHVKDSGSKMFQLIHSYDKARESNGGWIELHGEFITRSSLYDEFMIGASQLTGEESFIVIDYINIEENTLISDPTEK